MTGDWYGDVQNFIVLCVENRRLVKKTDLLQRINLSEKTENYTEKSGGVPLAG